MIVEIKRINKKRWHGHENDARYTDAPKTFTTGINKNTMRYSVDITDEELKFFQDRKIIPEDIDFNYDPETPHPFWDNSKLKIKLGGTETNIFNTDNPWEYLKYIIMKSKDFPYVAGSLEEYENGTNPNAIFYVHSEEQIVKKRATKLAIAKKARSLADKLSTSRKVQTVLLLTGKNLKNKSLDYLDVALEEIIVKTPTKLIALIETKKEVTEAKAIIKEGISSNILVRKDGGYHFNGSMLASTPEELLSFLIRPSNKSVYEAIKNKINKI